MRSIPLLIEALIQLSEQCLTTAKLLESSIHEIVPVSETILNISEDHSLTLEDFEAWPSIHYIAPKPNINIDKCNVLEYNAGLSTPISFSLNIDDIHLISDKFQSTENMHIKHIAGLDSLSELYDFAIVCESLEFSRTPIYVLNKIKSHLRQNGMMFIRFRPWSSMDGGFQSTYFNKAYAHLVCDLEHNQDVVYKVIRPISTYENLFKKCGFTIISRQVHNAKVDPFFTNNQHILDLLIKTWNGIRKEEALKILSTTNIDYVVSKC